MKTVKKNKRKIIIASIIAGIIAVLACAAVYIHVLSSPRPTVKQDPSPVEAEDSQENAQGSKPHRIKDPRHPEDSLGKDLPKWYIRTTCTTEI